MHGTRSPEIIREDFSAQSTLNTCFRWMWYVTVLMFAVMAFGMERIKGLLYWIYTVLNVICCIMSVTIKKSDDKLKSFDLMLIFIMMISMILSYICTEVKFSVDSKWIVGNISFLGGFFLVYYSGYIDFKNNKRVMQKANILISIFFLVISFTNYAYSEKFKEITLGLSNPNLTAIYLFLNGVLLLSMIKEKFKSRMYKLLILLLIINNLRLLIMTGARSSTVAYILVIFLSFRTKKRDGKYKVSKLVTILCVFFPLVFLFLYSYLYENRFFMDLEILGKTIYSGREVYFVNQLRKLNITNYGKMFGIFSGFNNYHNSTLMLLMSFGIVGTVIYYIFFLRNLFSISKNGFSEKFSYIAYISILALYVESCAEAAIVTGGGMMYIYLISMYGMAKQSKKNKEKVEKYETQ